MRTSLQWLVFGLLLSLCTTAMARQATLKDVRLWASNDKTRVVFDLSDGTQPKLFMLEDPLRLVVDVPDTRTAASVRDQMAGSGLVKQIRSGVRHRTDVRLVLDLEERVSPESFMLPPDADHGYRLVVDLREGNVGASNQVATNDGDTTRNKSKARTNQASDAAHESAADNNAAAMAQVSDASTAQSQSPAKSKPVARKPEQPSRDIVIVIDAGHGGKDPGAHGPGGTYEKDVVLQIARRLGAMVDAQPNMRAVLTRSGDRYIGLRQRMVEARKAKADLFISIHADAAPGGVHASGASVYALSHHGATSEHARWLARRENAADLVGGVSLKDKDDGLASFMLDLSQSASIEASLDAGRRVLEQLGDLGSLHKAEIQQAGFMVLKSPDIPSFLVETAFISNPAEERRLKTAGYQKKLARAMLQGINGYFASYRPSTIVADGQLHEVESGETLSEIAMQYGISVSRLRSHNELDEGVLRVGDELRIPAGSQQVAGLR